jgi:predicted aminopeptidase
MKKVLIGLGVVLFVLFLIYHELIIYGIGQGIGQMKVVYYARPISELLEDEHVSEEQKEKLRTVGDIRHFAIDELGLKDSDNYTSVYEQNGMPILWVVRACYPYELKNKVWTFPIVGTVSYKGFFDLEKAKKLRDELKDEGFDTYIREVSAWSTLGWFKDPLMSGVLESPEGELANTIIHELTHATIFIKDSLTFNENLASFIGDKGAEAYLAFSHGEVSEQYKSYLERKEDRKRFTSHFIQGAKILDSLYTQIATLDEVEKEQSKAIAIQQIVSSLDTVTFYNSRYKMRFKDQLPNNAFFMSYRLYRSDQEALDSLYKFTYDSNLKRMIKTLEQQSSSVQ